MKKLIKKAIKQEVEILMQYQIMKPKSKKDCILLLANLNFCLKDILTYDASLLESKALLKAKAKDAIKELKEFEPDFKAHLR